MTLRLPPSWIRSTREAKQWTREQVAIINVREMSLRLPHESDMLDSSDASGGSEIAGIDALADGDEGDLASEVSTEVAS